MKTIGFHNTTQCRGLPQLIGRTRGVSSSKRFIQATAARCQIRYRGVVEEHPCHQLQVEAEDE